jgi:steroid delta-isomerase-like uncharacterized protein
VDVKVEGTIEGGEVLRATDVGGGLLRGTQELAERYSQAWNDHDLDAIMALHTEDTVFDLHQAGVEPAVGQEAVRGVFDFLLKAWPDTRFETQRLTVREDFYVSEWVLTGTLSLPWQIGDTVIQPRGQKLSFPGVDIMSCENGKIKLKSCWLDVVSMQKQFGLKIGA